MVYTFTKPSHFSTDLQLQNNALSHRLEVKRNNFPMDPTFEVRGGSYNGVEGEVDSGKDVAGASEKQN